MSTTNLPRVLTESEYDKAAEEYCRSLPLEHFMESTTQSTQRKITLESLDLVHARRPDVQVFSELLVQYIYGRPPKLRQVVPDNMVVIWHEPLNPNTNYALALQPARPFWMLEYVSKNNPRKDYKDSHQKYERELKVKYYLVFHPEKQNLTLYKHGGRRYRKVPPNEHGRYPIPELDLEVGLLDRWVRFWYQGQLLPLPADLQRELDETRQRAEQERQRADQEQQRSEHERQRADQEQQRAEHERQRADQEQQRAEESARQAAELEQRLEREQQLRRALERELALLRSRSSQPTPRPGERPERS